MKIRIPIMQEVEIKAVRIHVPVRYEEEDIPNDFPLRNGDVWAAEVDMDSGQITGWPVGKCGEMYMKVCDGGTYQLIGKDGEVVGQIVGDYVPNRVVPGNSGDYIDFKINEQGIITNWPKNPDLSCFFEHE